MNLQGYLLGSQLDIICRLYQKDTGNNTYEGIKIIGVNNYSISSAGGTSTKHKEIGQFIGLTLAELKAIQESTGLSSFHHRYIFLERTSAGFLTNQGQVNGNHFFEYRVRLQGPT